MDGIMCRIVLNWKLSINNIVIVNIFKNEGENVVVILRIWKYLKLMYIFFNLMLFVLFVNNNVRNLIFMFISMVYFLC